MASIFTNESNYNNNSRKDAKLAKETFAVFASWREKMIIFKRRQSETWSH
jgi:hypothetical protein